MKKIQNIVVLALVSVVVGCVSSSPDRYEEETVDIYEQLKTGNVEYATEETADVKGSPEYVLKNIQEVRASYFRKETDKAKKLCKRIISVAPSTAEAYYWLARIAVDEGDFQQAYDLSSRALTLAKDANMKTELERIQTMSQMSAQ